MTVYIDSLFMINFFADSALLFFVQLFTKRNTGCIRIMLGAVFLSLYSLGSVFESVSFLYGIIPKATVDRKSTRLNSSHMPKSRMPSSA